MAITPAFNILDIMPPLSERPTMLSQEDDAAQPRIDSGDRVMIILMGFSLLLLTAAFAEINILIAITAAAAFAVLIIVYGKVFKVAFWSSGSRKVGSHSIRNFLRLIFNNIRCVIIFAFFKISEKGHIII